LENKIEYQKSNVLVIKLYYYVLFLFWLFKQFSSISKFNFYLSYFSITFYFCFPICLSSSKLTSHFSKFIPCPNYIFIPSCAVLFNYPNHLPPTLRFTLAPIAYSSCIVQSPPTSHHFCILYSLLQLAITLAYYATKHHFAQPLQHLIIIFLDLLPILIFSSD